MILFRFTMHLHFGHINFCFIVSESTLTMYPVISVQMESVRFSVSKNTSSETVAVDVLVVFSSHLFINLKDQQFVHRNQRFPVRVWLLTMSKGELSAVIAWQRSKCLRSKGSGIEELKKYGSPSPAVL